MEILGTKIHIVCRALHFLAFLWISISVHAEENGLRLGIAPHTSARVILATYQPLRQHLSMSLQRPVEIRTAPDFTEFARRALAKDYDLVITTGHQARLLQTDADFIPLLTYEADFKAVAVVNERWINEPIGAFQHKVILGLSPSSLVTLWGQHWLKQNHLQADLRYISAADSVGQGLVNGEGALGFMSLANYQNLPATMANKLKIYAESPAMAGRVYLLNHDKKALQKNIEQALWEFTQTPAGKAYFADNKLGGYRKLRKNELVQMDIYANEVRQVLRQHP